MTRGAHPPDSYLGQSLAELVPDFAGIGQLLARVVRTRQREVVELAVAMPSALKALSTHFVPIVEDDHVIGVLAVGLDVTDSKQASIELRMSVNALHRLLEEREQMAADLHDGILQSLYGIGLRLEVARVAGKNNQGTDQHVERAIAQLNETMAEIRRFIDVGRASLSANTRWEDALGGVLRSLTADGGPAIMIELGPAAVARVPNTDQSDVVFIAREAVSNAVRHAKATQIDVRLFEDDLGIRLEIEDNGVGFVKNHPLKGLGLLTMTRRAGRMGAVLTLKSAPRQGTKVTLEMTGVTSKEGQ